LETQAKKSRGAANDALGMYLILQGINAALLLDSGQSGFLTNYKK
jgi:hypothetical protein